MSDQLPEGWVVRTLPDLVTINPPKPPADALPAATPVSFVPMPAVNAGRGVIDGATEKPFAEVRKGYTAFADRDVLLAKITPCFENGKAAVALHLRNGLGFGSSEFFVLRSHGAVLPEYVFHYVRQQRFRDEGAEHMNGAVGQARVPPDFLRSVELPVAPLAEQKRIVDRVEALLADVSHAGNRLAKVPLILKRFRQSVLAAACSGKLTEEWRATQEKPATGVQLLSSIQRRREELNLPSARRLVDDQDIEIPEVDLPESWTWCRVGQIADVRLGGTPSRAEAAYWNGSIPWVSSGEVANCRIRDTAEHITNKGLENSNAKMYPRGTVLIAMIGEGKTRGQSSILDIDACTNQNAAGLIFDAGFVDPEYVWLWALGEYEKNRDAGRGGNQAALNGAKVRALPVPLPPAEEQAEIVRLVRRMFDAVDELDARVKAASRHADLLPQAILEKAFSGELVPTEAELAHDEGREYEPASALLARIASQTETTAVKPRRQRRANGKAASRRP